MKPTNATCLSFLTCDALSLTKCLGISLSIAFLLSACGEITTTEKIVEVAGSGVEVVTDVSLLPPCSATNEGELVWVKNEATPRMCSGGLWYAVAEGSVAATCSTEPLPDGSGVKILCGGDSIGVVLNGAKGEPGEKGDKGDTGAQGVQGRQGLQGVAGKDGTDGKDGIDGVNGRDGADGRDGVDGINGIDGADGKDGIDGVNGRDGNDGKDGAGCSMETIDELSVRVTCGTESTVLYVGELPDTTGQGEVVLDSEKIAISLDEVSGVTQKGPFLMGSKVLVREMEDGRTLTQTGNSFNGKILNDKGEFKINARMLVSQYVMLEATGYYRNEVTGENSNSELTLFAITDVNDRNIVNVNLLTHLEYERVIYLVTQKKMKVRAAKKQAQKEVFGLLNIDATDFSNSEDLNIAGASDEDGALLAFSLMFQGDRSVADLTALLQTVANDMEIDGTWDDATTRMNIAEWSADADSAGRLATIRNNVRDWGLSNVVPNFEQYVRAFWYKEYGLGDCTADSVGVVKSATAGKQQYSSTRYVCRNNGRWEVSGDFEKDTYGWKDSTDGALKGGDVTGKKYVFDATGSYNGTKGWRLAVNIENVYGGCVDSLFTKIRSYRGTNEAGYYLCQETTRTWTLVNSNLMIDTQGWAEGDDGFSKWGDSIGVVSGGSRICYVYDTSAAYNGWRTGNSNDCTLGLQGCTKGRAGVMSVSEKDGNYYNCVNNVWNMVSDEVKRNTYGWACKDTNAGEMRLGKVDDLYFVCNTNAWRKASLDEEKACRIDGMCRLCTEGMQGLTEDRDGIMYVCDKKNWREFNCAEKMVGLCTANDSSLVEACEKVGGFDIDYVCSDDHWHAVQHPFEYTLEAWNAKRDAYNAAAVEAGANSDSMITDPRDGNTYRTVVINGMRVFAENLRYADSVASVNLKGQTRCYNNETKNCAIGGRYYTWTAAVNLNSQWQNALTSGLIGEQHRGICPEGWHVPNNAEWNAMFSGVGYAAQQMTGYNGWTAATNASGFSVLPAGIYYDGYFYHVGSFTVFWSATEYDSRGANAWYLNANRASLNYDNKYYGFAVRCLQDYSTEP